MDEGLKFGGFNVTPAAGYCYADEVEIHGEHLDNNSFPTDKYHAWEELATSYLSAETIRKRDKGKEFLEFAKFAAKHMDRSAYCFVIRC